MKIAAFDTSSNSGSIAIMDGVRLVSELNVGSVGAHSEWLMLSFHGLLKAAGLAVKDIDLYALGAGPGSFTGLRIGVSAVKGLAWAAGKKVVAVSTIEALALNLRYAGMYVCPMLDARKGEVYSALYAFPNNGVVETVMKESALKPEDLFKAVAEAAKDRPVAFLGNGLDVYLDDVKKSVKDPVIAPQPLWSIRASNVGLLASERADTAIEAEALSPVYLRKSEAEIKGGL